MDSWYEDAQGRRWSQDNSMHRLEPSLDGSPLEICIALLDEQIPPEDASWHVIRAMNFRDELTFDLLTGASCFFLAASYLNQYEDIEPSLLLIEKAKERLREVALIWLRPRTCP